MRLVCLTVLVTLKTFWLTTEKQSKSQDKSSEGGGGGKVPQRWSYVLLPTPQSPFLPNPPLYATSLFFPNISVIFSLGVS